MRKGVLYLTAAAGIALACATQGQEVVQNFDRASVRQINLNTDGTPASPYTDRAVAVVYNTDTPAALCAVFLAPHTLDDCRFTPGPWATTTTTPRVARFLTVGVGNSQTTNANFDLNIKVWDNATFTANPMLVGTPLVNINAPIRNLAGGAQGALYTLRFTLAAQAFTVPDTDCYVEISAYAPGTTTLLPNTAGSRFVLWGVNANAVNPGSTTSSLGFDRNNNNIFEGGPINVVSNDHFSFTFGAGQCNGQTAAYMLTIEGDIPATPPTVFTQLNQLADGVTDRNAETLTAGQVKWYRFTIADDVTDALRTFLDIDSEGSAMNVDMALYNNAGDIIRIDTNDGSGENAQLTFGIGRRQKVGDGRQYDGRDGELVAAGNTFWLAVTGGPGTFLGGFNVTTTSTTAGAFQLHFNNNIISRALAPSVPPDTIADLGQLLGPMQTPRTLPGVPNILWYRFEICSDITNPQHYVDIDFSNSDPSGDADQEAFIFNDQGNLVFVSDDEGPGFFPQFSFGTVGPRPPYGTLPDSPNFDGSNGALPPGVYYMGVGHFNVVELSTAATDGRWHLRPNGGDNLEIQVEFYTDATSCDAGCHGTCPSDFDDGSGMGVPDGGVTIEDLLYYLVIFGDGQLCADLDDGSATGVPDGGVTIDDLLYFLVRFSDGC